MRAPLASTGPTSACTDQCRATSPPGSRFRSPQAKSFRTFSTRRPPPMALPRNAFRPLTVAELKRAFDLARDDTQVYVIIFTGKGTEAFCSGGDQAVRGKHGYVGDDNIGRLNILDVQASPQLRRGGVVSVLLGGCVAREASEGAESEPLRREPVVKLEP